ncbi:hypothetical protein [Demequina sp.]|uniref:hypothetical protein n=1 Tax=Demequina sp. TaxID=2050685 RepID=UPI003A846D05
MLSRALARTLPVALATSLLVAGCTGSFPAPQNPTNSAEPTVAPMAVGPLDVVPETYWAAPTSDGDITTVAVGGCPEGQACPGFVVLSGDALPTDTGAAVLDDGIACPGGDGLTPAAATPVETTDATIARERASLTIFEVSCVDAEGAEQLVVEQRQWVSDSAEGAVVVVDRWALDGLDRALAEASWNSPT